MQLLTPYLRMKTSAYSFDLYLSGDCKDYPQLRVKAIYERA
jgi:hypothetical protein